MSKTFGFSEDGTKRVVKATKWVEDQRSLVPEKRARGGIFGNGKPVQFLNYNFETEDQDGEQVNCHLVGNADKYLKVRSDWFHGIVLPGDKHWAVKWKGDLYAIGSGRTTVRGELESDLGDSAQIKIYDIGDTATDHQLQVFPSGDFRGLKSGMVVTCETSRASGSPRYIVTGMDDYQLSGTYENGEIGGFPARIAQGLYNVTGGGRATGLWHKDGYYNVIALVCADLIPDAAT